mgnify:FL=1
MTSCAAAPLHRRALRTLRDEQGGSAVETVLVMSVLIVILTGALQITLLFMGRAVARGAAQEGARVASAEAATISDGLAIAASFAADSGDALTDVRTTGARTPDLATVTVTGSTLSIFPGITPTITQTAVMPVERITG